MVNMRRIIEVVFLILAAAGMPGGAWAQRGYPQIEMVYPGAVSRGTTTEVLVSGHFSLRDPLRAIFEGEGISASVTGWKQLPEAKGYRKTGFPRDGVTLKVTVAEDAAPGLRPFRILTKGSLSTLGHLLLTDAPSINEVEPNDTIMQAQSIGIPQTVNGLLDQDEDMDV